MSFEVYKKAGKKLSASESEEYWKKHSVKVSEPIGPMLAFKELRKVLPKGVVKGLRERFSEPTVIQSASWPVLLRGRDLVSIARTGSGKTLGFLLPALAHTQRVPAPDSGVTRVVVLAPTRELAMQIHKEAEIVLERMELRALCVYGGVDRAPQARAARRGVEVVVGTPGRMQDLVEAGELRLGSATLTVLDEADRMLDLGFEPAVRAILGACAKERQTAMFSATWPEGVRALASGMMRKAVHVAVAQRDELQASESVTQHVEYFDDPRARDRRLTSLVRTLKPSRSALVLVFVLYKKEVPRVESLLERSTGFRTVALSGDCTQAARSQALESFRSGATPVLVATDVAARGLDVDNIAHVVNYSFPLTVEDYVHRIGRTGRAGRSGQAHTFFTINDKNLAGDLVRVLEGSNQLVPARLRDFGPTIKRKKPVDVSEGAALPKGALQSSSNKRIRFDSDSD